MFSIPLLGESALGQFNCAKAQSIYRRPFGGRPRPLYRLGITTQQTSRVVGEPCNSLHSSNKDWRCLSVKPAALQRSYPHLDISPGGWVGRKSKCSRPLAVAARRLRALVAPFGLGRAGHGSSLLNTQWALPGLASPSQRARALRGLTNPPPLPLPGRLEGTLA